MERNLRADPLIESAKGHQKQRPYFAGRQGENGHWLFCQKRKELRPHQRRGNNRAGSEVFENIIHFPLMSDFTDQQLENIWKEFAKYPKSFDARRRGKNRGNGSVRFQLRREHDQDDDAGRQRGVYVGSGLDDDVAL